MKFADFGFKTEILKALEEVGFTEPTEIQEKCIPAIMRGKDVIAQSKTGSGKTAAFGLPLLDKLAHLGKAQALILTPTRELCVQVSQALHEFGKFLNLRFASVYGGVEIEPQISALRGADIIIGTPGRVLDHIQRGTMDLSTVKFAVLDEVDRMSDMGFIEDVDRILHHVPIQRQTLVFSATITEDVNKLARRHMRSPEVIKAEKFVDESLLKQFYYNMPSRDKFSLFVHLLKHGGEGLKLVFCATRSEVDKVARNLQLQGVNAMAIHGGLKQASRLKALDSLRDNKIDVLVATDVAARGLDIKNVKYVYNYDVPKTHVEYVHRIGRTARAGEGGVAITLLAEPDYDNFRRILRDTRFDIHRMPNPQFQKVRFVTEFERSTDHLDHGKPRQGFRKAGFGKRPGFRKRGFQRR